MKITSLQLDQFKNYQKLSLDFPESPLVVIVGDNGQGKTNIVEALVVLALSKSFQNVSLSQLLNWEFSDDSQGLPPVFRIQGSVKSKNQSHHLEVVVGKTRKFPKTLKVDDLKMKASDYVGTLKVVLFTPQDINMVLLSPQIRRRYIDIFISQIDSEYLQKLSQYQKLLKQRNALIHQLAESPTRKDELSFWDEQMSQHGGYILWKRRKIFAELNAHLSEHYQAISSEEAKLDLQWKAEWGYAEDSPNETQSSFYEYLIQKRSRDIAAENTCGGPHRDDFTFFMNGKNLADFGSRGECRTAVLALKLAETKYIQEVTDDSPVLLFDDVFSELDLQRQQQFLKQFTADQIIITTTHVEYELEDATLWKVENGAVSSLT